MKIDSADKARRKTMKWIWDRRIPLGEITILSGPPSCGKSTLVTYLASLLSNGSLVGDFEQKRVRTLIISEEDDSSVIKERLDAGAAWMPCVYIGETDYRTGDLLDLSNESHLNELESMIVDNSIQLVCLDPYPSYLGAKTNLNRE